MNKANLTAMLIILSFFAHSQHDTTITYYPNGKVAMRWSSLRLESVDDLKNMIRGKVKPSKGNPLS